MFGGWRTLLENLARKLPDSSERQELLGAITRADTALDYEALGQIIKDHFPHREKDEAFRSAVAGLLKANPEQTVMARRVRVLNEIPFRAVLTLKRGRVSRRNDSEPWLVLEPSGRGTVIA